MTTPTLINPRIIAVDILQKVLHKKQSLSGLLPEDKLVRVICYGVLRHLPQLEFYASRLLKQPLHKQDLSIQMLLLIGLYQLCDMQIPDHAAVSETVQAARDMEKEWACPLVNGVLRSFQRQSDALKKEMRQYEEALYAHPEWMMDFIKKAWPQDWQKILEANNVKAPMFIRVNQQQIKTEAYLKCLDDEKIHGSLIDHLPSCIQLEEPVGIQKLPHFAEGFVSVQDAAPQMTVELLDLKPGLRVLDACAAPGGKTTHILEKEPQIKELISIDIDTNRSHQIKENLKRLKLKAVVIATDATKTESWWDHKMFDRILIDAPCSGLGVIRRHPDIKYLRDPGDFIAHSHDGKSFPDQQQHLLKKLWSTLKRDGLLVYTTCSIMPQENDETIAQFLKTHSDAVTMPIKLPYGFRAKNGWQVLPEINGADGFYYAVLKKK